MKISFVVAVFQNEDAYINVANNRSTLIPQGGFNFVLMDRKVIDAFNAIDVRHKFFQGDLLWTGYCISFIPYVRLKRTIGKSQYNFIAPGAPFIGMYKSPAWH